MGKLYTREIIKNQSQRIKEIRKKIDAHETLKQTEIIEFINLSAYNMHFDDDETKQAVESLIADFSPFLEADEKRYISSFPSQYMQRIFELVMANLISKKFDLERKEQEDVDLIITHLDQKYYIECATRTPGQMDKFYGLLPHFKEYHQIATIFKNTYDELIQQKLLINTVCYLDIITPLIWNQMSSDEKSIIEAVFETLGVMTESEIISKYNDWIYYNGYACLYFKEFIPTDLWQKYIDIDFPTNILSGDSSQIDNCIFAIDRIVEKIIDKLGKKYFHENVPILLSISIATFPEIIPVAPIQVFIEAIIENLSWKLTNAIDQHDDSEKLKIAVKNLFAILIDTCWYNWFPDIARNRHDALYHSDMDNYYAIIYNEKHPNGLQHNASQKIFNSLVCINASLPLSA